MRAQHDISKLRELYETGQFDDISHADIDDTVGNDGGPRRPPESHAVLTVLAHSFHRDRS